VERGEEAAPAVSTTEEPEPASAPEEIAEKSEQPEDEPGRSRKKKTRAPRAPAANLSVVRRERRALVRERERRIRDLGGLMLEMYRRDQFREDLILEHCAQALGIENRIHELDSILTRARSRRAATGPLCACGAPLLFGARFCANCGRPTDLAATGEICARCLQPLAFGAVFCSSCGAAVREGGESSEEDAEEDAENEQTIEHAPANTEGDRSEGGEP
jgi:uncharacterized Zn finger protein (UPF0148 family)